AGERLLGEVRAGVGSVVEGEDPNDVVVGPLRRARAAITGLAEVVLALPGGRRAGEHLDPLAGREALPELVGGGGGGADQPVGEGPPGGVGVLADQRE